MTVRPFILSAVAAAARVAPELTLAYDETTDTLSITSNAAGVVFWSITTSASATSAAVIAGSGVLNGSINTTPGTIAAVIDSSSLNPVTTYYLHAVLTSGGSAISAVESVQLKDPVVWYESDALFAWNSLTDSDAAAINPERGGTVPLVTGAGAAISSGLWDMDTNRYASSTGATATTPLNIPALFAFTLNPDNTTSSYAHVSNFGSSVYAAIYVEATAVRLQLVASGGSAIATIGSLAALGGLHVLWGYWDGLGDLTVGFDQTTAATATQTASITAQVIQRDVRVGGRVDPAVSKMKHGAMQLVSRAGMSLADAKAIVAKMQTLHGI